MKTKAVGKAIKVLIGQVAITRSPNVLQSVLGSCIGMIIYDEKSSIAGMAHVLLPSSEGRDAGHLPGKYADRAVPCVYDGLLRYGALPANLRAKISGGANMFSGSIDYAKNNVGASNTEAVRKALQALHIPIVSSDVGGNAGRKVEFDISVCKLHVSNFENCSKVI